MTGLTSTGCRSRGGLVWRCAAGLLVLLTLPAAGATRFLAVGDSITFGTGDPSGAGYPPRLETLLHKAGLQNAEVLKFGVPGEDTFDILARINSVLAVGGDCVLLIGGTNDVEAIIGGLYGAETTAANLDAIANKSRAAGYSIVHSTIIPRSPHAKFDRLSLVSRNVTWAIREMVILRRRPLADPWEDFNLEDNPNLFEENYSSDPSDTVGHPNSQGYSRIAETFADVILEMDTVPPVPGPFEPVVFGAPIDPKTQIRASVLEPTGSTGINYNETFLVINGKKVAGPDPDESTRRRAELTFKGDLGCKVAISLQSADRADPPNVIDRLIALYDIEGREAPEGDIDFDCRVDGEDLVMFAYAFGSALGDPLYHDLLDFNNDGKIDGRDFSRLAANFGVSSI